MWSSREDVILQALVKNLGTSQWETVAGCLNGLTQHVNVRRTGHECRTRWTKLQGPEVLA